MKLSSFKENIEKYQIISFDMYDTLVNRNVMNPEDVFSLVEWKYNKSVIDGNKILGFREKRVHAYHVAYEKKKASCCLDDIYNELIGYDDVIKNTLKSIEIEIEKKISVPNKDIVELFEYAKNLGKRVVIISDMYLPILEVIHIRLKLTQERIFFLYHLMIRYLFSRILIIIITILYFRILH